MSNGSDSLSVFCTEQVMRLSHLPRFYFHEEAIEEIAAFMAQRSHGDRHAIKSVVDEASEFTECPSKADLRAVWERLYPTAVAQHSRGCKACGGIGYVIVHRGEFTGAARCGCLVPAAQVEA